MDDSAVRSLLVQKVKERGSQSEFARRAHISCTVVSMYLSGSMPKPPPKLLHALGLRKVVAYEPVHPQDGKESGFAQLSLLQYGVIALGILLALGSLVWWADANIETSAGVKKGEANVQAKWEAQKLADAELERRRGAEVGKALLAEKKKAEAAEQKAKDIEAENRRRRDEARRNRKSLALCEEPRPDSPSPSAAGGVSHAHATPGIRASGVAGARPAGPVVRLLWRLVGLHDGAFSGLQGEPLSSLAAQLAGDPGRADAPSPYTLDDALDAARENAFRLSACRRDVAAARAKVEAAAAAWDRANGEN